MAYGKNPNLVFEKLTYEQVFTIVKMFNEKNKKDGISTTSRLVKGLEYWNFNMRLKEICDNIDKPLSYGLENKKFVDCVKSDKEIYNMFIDWMIEEKNQRIFRQNFIPEKFKE